MNLIFTDKIFLPTFLLTGYFYQLFFYRLAIFADFSNYYFSVIFSFLTSHGIPDSS